MKHALRGDLIKTYKIVTNKENIDSAQFFEFTDTGHDLRGHSLKLSQSRNRSRVRRMFFSQRIVADWNRLPQYVVDAPSTKAFKNRLDKYWRDDGHLKRLLLRSLIHKYNTSGATKHRIGYIEVQIMLLLDMTRYKVVKGKRLGSVLVKQFSRALPGWGLGRGSPQNIINIAEIP